MRPSEILSELQARQVELVVVGDRLRFRPVTAVPEPLLEALRAHKAEVMDLVELQSWPEISRDAVLRFGKPCARLYPFLGREVETPRGRGRLLKVFAERVMVVLDTAPSQASFFLPSEVRPPGVAVASTSTEPEVH
ncbi:MAG TPA: hypothetical protein VLF66_07130 [Thermoanaerobaculia bacterium]|nr:hypothetical protein [Thermoanaerobaculia bacterium]